MAKCSFCGRQIIQGRGIIFVENSGRVVNYCSSKCRKNRDLGREAKKLKWTEKFREGKKA
jgi:large subunit ribosomal protein L24e